MKLKSTLLTVLMVLNVGAARADSVVKTFHAEKTSPCILDGYEETLPQYQDWRPGSKARIHLSQCSRSMALEWGNPQSTKSDFICDSPWIQPGDKVEAGNFSVGKTTCKVQNIHFYGMGDRPQLQCDTPSSADCVITRADVAAPSAPTEESQTSSTQIAGPDDSQPRASGSAE